MEDYEELYHRYRSRYYDACDEVNACERAIASWKGQRRRTVNRINELNADIRKTNDAISDMQAVLNHADEVAGKLEVVSGKMELASSNYSNMVEASDVSQKSLSDIFRSEASTTQTSINNIFETVRNRKNTLGNTLSDMKNQLNNANSELVNIDDQIRSEKASLSDWVTYRNNCFYNMEYYKRKMQEVG